MLDKSFFGWFHSTGTAASQRPSVPSVFADTLVSVEVLIPPSGMKCERARDSVRNEKSSSVTGFSLALGVMNQLFELRYPSFQTASVLLKVLMHSIEN